MASRNVEKFIAWKALPLAGTCQATPNWSEVGPRLATPLNSARVLNCMPSSPTALGVLIVRPPSAARGSLKLTLKSLPLARAVAGSSLRLLPPSMILTVKATAAPSDSTLIFSARVASSSTTAWEKRSTISAFGLTSFWPSIGKEYTTAPGVVFSFMVWVSLSPPQAASSMAGISARVLNCFMACFSSELQGDGAADYVYVAVCGYVGFVTVVIHQGEIALLQLLVLIAQIEANRVGQQAGTVVGGANTKANHNLVGVQIVEVRIAGGFQGRFFIGQAAAQGEVLTELVFRTDTWNEDVVELNLRAIHAVLHANGVAIKCITELGPVLLLHATTYAPSVTGVLHTGDIGFRLEGVDGGNRQAQARVRNGLGNDDVGVYRGGSGRLGAVSKGRFPAVQETVAVRAEGATEIYGGAQNRLHGGLCVHRQAFAAGFAAQCGYRIQLRRSIQGHPDRQASRNAAPQRRSATHVQEQRLFTILQELAVLGSLRVECQHFLTVLLHTGNKAQINGVVEASEGAQVSFHADQHVLAGGVGQYIAVGIGVG